MFCFFFFFFCCFLSCVVLCVACSCCHWISLVGVFQANLPGCATLIVFVSFFFRPKRRFRVAICWAVCVAATPRLQIL
uniref:Secreted protein n=1 Tax=Rhipicephalus microplus TaxID=6941 RepID=A0A6M2DBV5_RHIMP